MPVSEAQKRASKKWKEKHVKRISVDVSESKKLEVESTAKSIGESMNMFVKKAIDERLLSIKSKSED